jgi:integrase
VGGFTIPGELAKNGEPRFIPLVGAALEIVERRLANLSPGTDCLYAGDDGRPRQFPRHAWERALKRAKIENFRFHDLRHTHASYLAMLGATSAELKESLGHKTLAMVARYTHLANSHKRQVAARLAAELGEWQSGNPDAMSPGDAPSRANPDPQDRRRSSQSKSAASSI